MESKRRVALKKGRGSDWTFLFRFSVTRTSKGKDSKTHRVELLKILKTGDLGLAAGVLLLILAPLVVALLMHRGHRWPAGDSPPKIVYRPAAPTLELEAVRVNERPLVESSPVITPLNVMDPTALVFGPSESYTSTSKSGE